MESTIGHPMCSELIRIIRTASHGSCGLFGDCSTLMAVLRGQETVSKEGGLGLGAARAASARTTRARALESSSSHRRRRPRLPAMPKEYNIVVLYIIQVTLTPLHPPSSSTKMLQPATSAATAIVHRSTPLTACSASSSLIHLPHPRACSFRIVAGSHPFSSGGGRTPSSIASAAGCAWRQRRNASRIAEPSSRGSGSRLKKASARESEMMLLSGGGPSQ